MSSQLKDVILKASISEEMSNKECFNTPVITSLYTKNNPERPKSGTSYEVFRNNTTAIEVVVKDVPLRRRRTKTTLNDYDHINDTKIQQLEEENEILKMDLNQANAKLAVTRKELISLVTELKNQLVTANRREIEQQYVNIKLNMENEKLKTHLESKSKLVNKLKKELAGMQKLLKYVVKGLKVCPKEYYTVNSDAEYDEFENGLKHETRVSFSPTSFNVTTDNASFDGNMSKNMDTF